MEGILFPVFHPERGMNERQELEHRVEEEMVKGSEEMTTGLESRTESERQLDEVEESSKDGGDGSLADDEEEEDDDDDNEGGFAFTPLVTVMKKTANKQTECSNVRADDVRADDVRADDVRANDVRADDVCTHGRSTKSQKRCLFCGEVMTSVLFLLLGVVMFPLLVWAGYDLLPFDLPVVQSTPYRLLYSLRCALFATIPIILGVLVQGVSHLKFSSPSPLFEGQQASRHTLVHITYVQDSLRLFLLFFLQLTVTSTYVHQHALRLIPLLTIVFVFGRLIYWPGVCFSSTVRVLGFSLSFLPIVALLGLNLYFICSSTGEGVVFDFAPPTTAPPPKARWWG